MSRYRRGDNAPPAIPPDSPEGKDLGLDDHLLPGGQPHITNKAVMLQEAPRQPDRPEYRGGMAHGVAVPGSLDVPQDRQPASQMHFQQATSDLATFTPRDVSAEQETPIAVRIVEDAPRRRVQGSYRYFRVPPLGSDPVRIAGRDPRRSALLLYNESAAPATTYSMGTYTGATGSVSAPSAGTIVTNSTIWLPDGVWTIGWTVGFSAGTPAGGDDNNFELMSPTATQLAVSVNVHGATPVTYPQAAVTLTVPAGGQLVTVKAIGNATAGVTYTAVITATPVTASIQANVPFNSQGAATTGPTAGTVIGSASQSSEQDIGAGTYTVDWTVTLTGTMTAAETNNFGLYFGTLLLAISANPNAVGSYHQPATVTFTATAAGKLTVKAIANAGGSAVYSCSVNTFPVPVTPPVPPLRIATFPGDLAEDLAAGTALSGAVLPAGGGTYQRLITQSEVFAICTSTTAYGQVSVIAEYELPL